MATAPKPKSPTAARIRELGGCAIYITLTREFDWENGGWIGFKAEAEVMTGEPGKMTMASQASVTGKTPRSTVNRALDAAGVK